MLVSAGGAAAVERGQGDVPGALDSYCTGGSQGRATCTAISEMRGAIVLAIATSRDSVESYKVCARGPGGKQRCLKRDTRNTGQGTVGDAFRFGKYFPDRKPGRYDVSWFVDGRRVGPALHFDKR